MKKTWSQKRIPTLLGLGVLVLGLVVGIIFLGQNFDAFSPRATAQTTPKNVEITNITDSGFTVSFLTDDSTTGFMKYGSETTKLNQQVGDDRDQISGTVTSYTTHYISVRELQPNTSYYFTLGTGSGSKFDDNGQPYTIKTASRGGNPGAALTIYGNVLADANKPASGSIVYAEIVGVGKLSSLVKESGSWSIPLSNAKKSDGSGYASVAGTTPVTLRIQGISVQMTASTQTTVAEAQPAAAITLGMGGTGEQAANSPDVTASPSESPSVAQTSNTPVAATPGQNFLADLNGASRNLNSSDSAVTNSLSQSSSSSSSALVTENQVIDLQSANTQVVTTDQPVIVGQAPANVKITVQIHSIAQINTEVQADDTGSYSVDLAELSKNLEPGTHTVTISYTDPQTGKVVTQQKTFTVEPKSTSSTQQLALAQTSSTPLPYGTSNPYPIIDSSSSSSSSTATLIGTDESEVRAALPATDSGIPDTGTIGTTFALIGTGIFLVLAGSWSLIMSRRSLATQEVEPEHQEENEQ